MLLELLGSREKKSKASSCFPLSMVCVTLRSQPFAWVPRGVYIGLPPGGTIVIRLGAGPSRQCLRSPASPPAVGARRQGVSPAAGLLADRSVASYRCLAPNDEGFVEVSMATVLPPGGFSL